MKVPAVPWQVGLALLFAAGVGVYVLKRGGIAQAASGAGAAIVNAAGNAASGAVGAIGAGVGLPTPDQTTTDPRVARWLIDNAGYWQASFWCGLPALVAGARMEPGTGQPPAAGSDIAKAFPNFAAYDESTRLLNRYPAPAANAPTDVTDWNAANSGVFGWGG